MRNGAPLEAIDIMLASLSKASIKQYGSGLKQWWQFCAERRLSPFEVKVDKVLIFLTKKYEEGASYGTLNSIRSAISLLTKEDLGKNFLVKRFFEGVYKLRPTKPKYCKTWEVDTVIDYLEPMFPLEDLKLAQASYKTLMLLAISTAHRAQTFSKINVDNIHRTQSALEILITDVIKTSSPGRNQPVLVLPFIADRPSICVASNILNYIEKTKDVRDGKKKLFLSFKKPYKEIGSQTISRR